MDKVKLYCNECDEEFYQNVEYISDINWICPKCKSDRTWLREYIGENINDREIKLGKGGCGRTG